MIVSFKRKFIFVALPKNASHSVRAGLRPLMCDGDWEQCDLFERKRIPIPEVAQYGHGHLTARQIEQHLPHDSFKGFFSFAFVRNPFDRFVSFSAFINRDNEKMTKDPLAVMKRSLKDPRCLLHILMRPQYEFICRSNGEVMVSHVAHCEDIQKEFDFIRARIGVESFQLPRANSSERKSYQDYYDDELKQMVLKVYSRDFEIFGYDPEMK